MTRLGERSPTPDEGPVAAADGASAGGADEPALEVTLETGALDVVGELGRGGLSVVHRARQGALAREVALKRVRPDRRSRRAEELLLQEARIAAGLEHPGVVPIHELRWSEAGEPLVVMQRISGHPWSRLIHDVDAWRGHLGRGGEAEPDWLSWHLRVLLRVCEVVEHAHARGYIHRDLKPDNVMVGALGEVYLVDWGLALRLGEAGHPAVAHVSSATRLTGTPAYMAPEMLGERRPQDLVDSGQGGLGVHTDVFQLGAVLYELLCGQPPYWGPVDTALFGRIGAVDLPELTESAHPWLAAISARAMQRRAADRYASVGELRAVVQHVLEHRGADRLARAAGEGLDRMRAALRREQSDTAEVYAAWGQVRLGFQQALEIWPHHAAAQEGLVEAAGLLAEHQLRAGDPEAAARILAELGEHEAPEGLPARVELARQQRQRSEAETAVLSQMGRTFDVREGRRARTGFLVVLGLIWTTLPWIPWFLAEDYPVLADYPVHIGSSVAFIFVALGLVGAHRQEILGTAINRGIAGGVILTLVGQVAFDLGAREAGLDPLMARAFHMLLWSGLAAVLAAMVEWRVILSSLVFLGAFAICVHRPDLVFPVVSVGSLVFVGNMIWIWGSPLRGR